MSCELVGKQAGPIHESSFAVSILGKASRAMREPRPIGFLRRYRDFGTLLERAARYSWQKDHENNGGGQAEPQ
jgi:hypothetical protein